MWPFVTFLLLCRLCSEVSGPLNNWNTLIMDSTSDPSIETSKWTSYYVLILIFSNTSTYKFKKST